MYVYCALCRFFLFYFICFSCFLYYWQSYATAQSNARACVIKFSKNRKMKKNTKSERPNENIVVVAVWRNPKNVGQTYLGRYMFSILFWQCGALNRSTSPAAQCAAVYFAPQFIFKETNEEDSRPKKKKNSHIMILEHQA